MDNLAIIICATRRFQYALLPQARALKQNLTLAGAKAGHIILVTDKNPVAGILERLRGILGGFNVHHIALDVEDEPKNYKTNANLLIAQLYTAGFDRARELNVDYVWTLESDVIPEPNNLRCMRDVLAFDGGYYDVTFCPYVSSGGGGIMGGRGSAGEWIKANWTIEEAKLTPELEERITKHKAAKDSTPAQEWAEEMHKLTEEAKRCAPKGNVFELNSKGWKPRGWLEWAYPAIGKGAIVPSDWFPMGNNLFNRRAVQLVDFTGYGGRGTQDLYLSYRLAAHGLRFCVIPHSTSSHVTRRENQDKGQFTMYQLYHETLGDCVGHLRQREIPFYSFEAGERAAPIEEDFSI